MDDLDIPPLLLRKKDGTTLYATRDLAAALYRWESYRPERSLYVVDRGQGLHFRQLFATLERAGCEWVSRCEHIPFGLVRVGGVKTGTRSGNVVLLRDVFAEATEGSRARIAEKNPEMGAAELEETARAVGIGAVIFANLVSQREKDVDFAMDDVLALEGDSGPYIQYSHARCCAILEKAEVDVGADAPTEALSSDFEWALARQLSDFPDIVLRATDTCEPHLLCRYLLEVSATFSRWYTSGNQEPSLRVLCQDDATRRARVALVKATRVALERGLELLGIAAPRSM